MQKNIKRNRVIALALAALLAVSALAVGLSGTLAAKADIDVALAQPNTHPTLQAGTQTEIGTVGGRRVTSSDTSVATATISSGDVTVKGVKAGITAISIGSSNGNLMTFAYQIFSNTNISGYTLKQGGEVFLNAANDTAARNSYLTGVTPNANAADTIKWRSLQAEAAQVDENTGKITATGKGATIVIGKFTDQWGVERDIHILVMVGVRNSSLGDLLEWIAKGETILGLPAGDVYTTDSVDDLQNAVDGGKDVAYSADPSEQDIKNAIKEIQDAINGLDKKPGAPSNILGPDGDGNYYRPVGDPPNVYEAVDKDGNSKQPPEYIYDHNTDGDSDPSTGNDNVPAEKDNGLYYVEDPENIWHQVKGDGTLRDEPALWGGADGKPGGGDDKPANKFGNDWWVDRGQNVWQKVDPSKPKGPLGPLTGGGPDRDPSTDPVTEIYEHNNGKFYVGPMGVPGQEYYYGDPPGGDSYLDSTMNGLEGDDVRWYKDSSGNMTTTPPVGDGDPTVVGEDGRILTSDKTGDSEDWIEIARSGGYSLIIRKSYINTYGSHYGEANWQGVSYDANNGGYRGSGAEKAVNNWFKGKAGSGRDNLPLNANLRNFTMYNDSSEDNKVGTVGSQASKTDGFSKPSKYQLGEGNNVAFILSFSEAANFCSVTHEIRGANPQMQPSNANAVANYHKLVKTGEYIMLRSPGDTSNTMGAIWNASGSGDGRAFQHSGIALIYPALWVNSAIFD